MKSWRPGRDRRAVRHPGPSGLPRPAEVRRVVVVGGGIAGLAAAVALAERGVAVELVERRAQFGGRVRSWPVGDGRTMSRGFHAFFRQYYTLRALLRRADPELSALRPVTDYPLRAVFDDGTELSDSFAAIPRTPPWSILGFVATSPSFPIRALAGVDVPAALRLVSTDFPRTFTEFDGCSAADFLDRLGFPDTARHLALEVFARSFFADPREFSAGELVAMFHSYFTGSAEGLLFDVPVDDYDTVLWAPLADHLVRLGARLHPGVSVTGIELGAGDSVVHTDTGSLPCDAVVLATDPATTRELVAGLRRTPAGSEPDAAWQDWRQRIAGLRSAPPFAVHRLWLADRVSGERPAFLGTSGFGPLDNISVLERFEDTARSWAERTGGSVVELHAYAVDRTYAEGGLRADLREQLDRVYPELRGVATVAEEWLVADDCGLVGTEPWAERPGVVTPDPRLVLAGDTLRCDWPVALMERAAVTGFQAANRLLAGWQVAGHDLWTVPLRGLLPASRRPGSQPSVRSA
ncbi:FAD-dependent oxidoreductase [Enemella evansiae]|uniref:Isorenieratene synthase n=1 Tax=Enemella evansiae TaxID=2016499 RepID=A0A255GJJ2_9ACTN|nr:FAD-dependent oxidoreductase [Enemella evansiae]OYO13787.1 isorenieratene synthase [Enemella evansiae]OYO16018.1 isorenieratene synthase [Enemella evansiae]